MLRRWTAVTTYRTDAGPSDVTHEMEELEELQDLIEQGPSWYCIDRIVVTHNRREDQALTVEEAAKL